MDCVNTGDTITRFRSVCSSAVEAAKNAVHEPITERPPPQPQLNICGAGSHPTVYALQSEDQAIRPSWQARSNSNKIEDILHVFDLRPFH